jgi:CubicO group peptidase (beta-lactamase class C family)
MTKLLIAALLLVGSIQSAGAEAKLCASPAVGEAVKQTVAGRATGVVLVARGGCILWRGGIGDARKGIPTPQPDTIFDALSIGKTFTAIAAQELANRRRIALSSPIRRYVPKLPEAYGDITIQDALDNNGGLAAYLPDGDDTTPRTAEGLLRSLTPALHPRRSGSGYAYSNVGFHLLGLMVQTVTQEDIASAMRRLVFAPAGLQSTEFFSAPSLKRKSVAVGYVNGKRTGSPATWPHTWSLLGAAGIGTTVDDLYRLNRYFIAGAGLGLAGRKRMLAPGASTGGRGPMHVARKDTISYGSGLYQWRDAQGRHIHFHGGDGDFGFHALMLWREEDDVFIAGLFNSGSPADSFSREEFTSEVLAAAERSRK